MVDQRTWDLVTELVAKNIRPVVDNVPLVAHKVINVISAEIEGGDLRVNGAAMDQGPTKFEVEDFIWVNCSDDTPKKTKTITVKTKESLSIYIDETIDSIRECKTTISAEGSIGIFKGKFNRDMIKRNQVTITKSSTQIFETIITKEFTEEITVSPWSKLTIRAKSSKNSAKLPVEGLAVIDAVFDLTYTIDMGRRNYGGTKRLKLSDLMFFAAEPKDRTIPIGGYITAETYEKTEFFYLEESISSADVICQTQVSDRFMNHY